MKCPKCNYKYSDMLATPLRDGNYKLECVACSYMDYMSKDEYKRRKNQTTSVQ